MIAPTPSGAPDFHALRSAMAWNAERLADAPAGVPQAMTGLEWLKPGIKARVKHLRGEAKLRHASVKGIVDDGT